MELIVATEYLLSRIEGQLNKDPKLGKVVKKDLLMTKSYFDSINDNVDSTGRICVENKTKTKEALKEIEDRKARQAELKVNSQTVAQSNLASKLLEDLADKAIKSATDKSKKGGTDGDN